MEYQDHELIKTEVGEAVEAAAIALINATASGDRDRYQQQLRRATSEIHQMYMQVFMLEHTRMVS